jgi:hypothetical protein
MEACYDLGLPAHFDTNKTPSSNVSSSNVPHKFTSIYDTNTPGFGYCSSDLKNPYLSREQLNSRLVSPSINLDNYQDTIKIQYNKQ